MTDGWQYYTDDGYDGPAPDPSTWVADGPVPVTVALVVDWRAVALAAAVGAVAGFLAGLVAGAEAS